MVCVGDDYNSLGNSPPVICPRVFGFRGIFSAALRMAAFALFASDLCCVPRVVWLGVSRWVDLLAVCASRAFTIGQFVRGRHAMSLPRLVQPGDIENGASEIDRI